MSTPKNPDKKPESSPGLKKRPTLKTIAYMTGLGITTVSKALKDAPDIGAETKERVKLIAKEIGYQPDRAGLRLRTGKTNIISLVLDTEEEVTGYASQLIIGITQALEETSYNLTVTPYSHKDDPLQPVRNIVESRAADGVILSRIEPNDQRLAYLSKYNIPFATHGRSDMGLDHAFYDYDNLAFAYEAVKILANAGRKRVGLLAAPQQFSYAYHMQEGFLKGVEETGLSQCPIAFVNSDGPLDRIAEKTCDVLKSATPPDGIICGSVGSTVGVVGGIEKAGLVVGRDVDVVCKQSTKSFLKWFGRPVYSIDEDVRGAGFGLAKSLEAIIDGASAAEHQTLAFPNVWGKKVTSG